MFGDGHELVIGWRTWKLCSNGLVSLYQPTHWPVRRPLLAKCKAKTDCGHRSHLDSVPGLQCLCGVYATRERQAAVGYATRQPMYGGWLATVSTIPVAYVIGQVSLAGKLVEHKDGWRAELAYPYSLYVRDRETADALGAMYGVETHVLTPWPEPKPVSNLFLTSSLAPPIYYGYAAPADPPKPKPYLAQRLLGGGS